MNRMFQMKSLVIALGLLLGGTIATADAIVAEEANAEKANISDTAAQISIRLEAEPRLQAPLRTLVSASPQTFIIEFPEPMDHESVAKAIEKQSAASDNPYTPELKWDFDWINDRTVHVHVSVIRLHPNTGYYLQGDYQVNVNESLTIQGKPIANAPIFAVSIQSSLQLWRYSTDGEVRELITAIDDPYSFRILGNSDSYLLGIRPIDYCECDAILKKLYALYDLQEKQLIRYPVVLQTNYMGKGDFVVDRRGFFYEQPEQGIQVPQSNTASSIHVDGYVHGASLSKDGKYVFMAVGKESQENDLTLLLYSLDKDITQVLDESVNGWIPEDQGLSQRMPVQFKDDGEHVYFVLNDRPYRELRNQYAWRDGTITESKLPIPDESWSGFSASSDNVYRYYANGGLFHGTELVYPPHKLPFWSEVWVNGTHKIIYSSGELDRSGQNQYTNRINVFDADRLEDKTLYTGLYHDSMVIGSSKDGKWIYVSAREPVHHTAMRPAFGEGDGKLLAHVRQNVDLPITLYLNETKLQLEHSPNSVDDYALFVPLREVLEAAEWKITWQAERQTILGEKTGRTDRAFKFNIGESRAEFNGRVVELPIELRLVGDTTYMYAGILQKLGMMLEWDDSKRVLFIRQMPETGGVVLPDGSKYEGDLIGDVPSGKGMLFDKVGRLIYEGEFKAGKFHGQGKLYSETGQPDYFGLFELGEKRE